MNKQDRINLIIECANKVVNYPKGNKKYLIDLADNLKEYNKNMQFVKSLNI